ncbi:MAG: MFS transporter [Myxococcota bacterium]
MSTVLRLVYGFYFAAVAVEYVFLPFFFTRHGLSAADIGVLFTGRVVMVTVLQPRLSALADQLGRPHALLKIALTAQFAGATLLGFGSSFAEFAAVVWIQAAFRAPVIPVMDSTTVRLAGADGYGRIRAMGSIGFGVCATALGQLSVGLDYETTGELAILVYPVITACAGIATLLLPQERDSGPSESAAVEGLLHGAFVMFITWNALHWTAIAAYNTFFSLYTKELGLSPAVPGIAMGVSIVGEAAAFVIARRLFRRGHVGAWVVAALAVSSLRWVLTAWTRDPVLLVSLQCLHFFSFGLWYAAAIDRIGVFAPPEHRATFQGVFSAGVLSLGSIAGSLGGGWLFESVSGSGLFLVAAGIEGAALLLALASWRSWTISGTWEGR